MGIMSDKDVKGIMSPLLPLASDKIFTAPDYGRAASPQKLAEIALHMGFSSRVANSVRDAIDMAKKCCESENRRIGESEIKNNHFTHSHIHTFTGSLILITGSLYTIGEALEILGKKAVLGTLRETV
jgi:dihydrofolate synthase/folylpolyglutamate synthase